MTGFELSITTRMKIHGIHAIHLSLAQYEALAKKSLSGTGHTKTGRLTPREHLQRLIAENRLTNPDRPLLVLSTRNVLANLRCMGYIRGYTASPVSVAEENTVTDRAYHILALNNTGQLTIREYHPAETKNSDAWFFSGIPVLWDDEPASELLQRIVPEAADHSHVWQIPRGHHPLATDQSRAQWEALQSIFLATLTHNRPQAFDSLQAYAKAHHLEREDHYFHHILGTDAQGKMLYQLASTGRLEALGQQIKQLGATRAICVDNSGSVTVQFYPQGVEGDAVQLIAAPNQRQAGTAYLIIELSDSGFSWLA